MHFTCRLIFENKIIYHIQIFLNLIDWQEALSIVEAYQICIGSTFVILLFEQLNTIYLMLHRWNEIIGVVSSILFDKQI